MLRRIFDAIEENHTAIGFILFTLGAIATIMCAADKCEWYVPALLLGFGLGLLLPTGDGRNDLVA